MGSEKLEALFVKRAICRPIIRQRSERRKESTLRRVCARGASVRNRTSPAGLGIGGGSGGGKREISCSHDKLEFAIFVLRSSRQRHVPGGHPPLPTFLSTRPIYQFLINWVSSSVSHPFSMPVDQANVQPRPNAVHRLFPLLLDLSVKICGYI